ncbi:MAG: transporter substrate-binding domain-containing protein [Candidatus Electrothrix communis]|nr:MAG: transporter substrate-binding domain-containing protein [Candidatus Electrothrix communis]
MSRVFCRITALILCICISPSCFAENRNTQGAPDLGVAEQVSELIGLTEDEQAWLADHPVIRVGESSEFEPQLIKRADGSFTGIVPEFYRLLEKRLGIRFKIIDDAWSGIIRRASEGKIDVVSLMNRQLAQEMGLLTVKPCYNMLPTVFAKKNSRLKFTKDEDLEGLRVAYFKDIVFLQRYFDERKERIEAISADTPLDAFTLLLRNKADVAVGFNLDAYLLIKNSILEIEPVYAFQELSDDSAVAVQPNMPLLADILQKAMNSISYEEQAKILSKWSWIPEQRADSVELNPEERAWLVEHPVVRVYLDAHRAPVEFRDNEGRYQGIAVEYLKHFEKVLGIRLEAAKRTSWAEGIEKMRHKKLDMIATISETGERRAFAVFTEPYLSMPVNIFARNDISYIGNLSNLTNRRAAVLESTAVAEWLTRDYPDITQVAVQATDDGLKMVAAGKVDAFIGNVVTGSYYLGKLRLNNVRIAGETSYTYDLSVAVRDDWPIFVGILQKALDSIEQPEREAFFNRWMSIRYEHGTDYTLLWKILAAVIALLILFSFWNRQLSKEVRQRKQAEDAARAANRAKSIFLANMSHDLHTPLNAILGFSEMMRRDHAIDSAQQEKLDIINRSAVNLLNIIDDILELARIDAGRVELKPEIFDLPELLRETEERLKTHAGTAGQRFIMELDPDLPCCIRMDRDKLRHILINLLSNALNITGKDCFLRVRCLPAPDDSAAVTVQIEAKNNDTGISADRAGHLFEALSPDQSEEISYKNSGPGLIVSRSFIELMGGELSLNRTPEEDTLFRIDFPAFLTDEPVKTKRFKETQGELPVLESCQDIWRILVVDDIPENRLLLNNLLLQAGFQTREAANGEQAVALFEEWHPHLIWMDLHMPVMNGYKATRHIRALPGGDRVKIAALTAGAFKEQHREILAAGCDEVLHKPFRVQNIFDSMKKHLEVRYIYEGAEDAEHVPLPVILTAEMLAKLPDEQKKALRMAAQKLDIAATEEVLRKIRSDHPETGEGLLMLTREFRFSRILELLEGEEKSDKKNE